MSRRSTAIHVGLGVLLTLNLLLAAWPGGWAVIRAQGPDGVSGQGTGAQGTPPAGAPGSRLPSLPGLALPSEPTTPAGSASPDRAAGGQDVGPWPTHWYTVVGMAFQPSSSGMTYSNAALACLSASSDGTWRASVNLPDGAVAKYIYINYENLPGAPPRSGQLQELSYNGVGNDLAWVDSRPYASTGTGYFYDLSREITYTINNELRGYVFRWEGTTTQKLCSMQIGYYPPPLSSLYLPLVTRAS